MAEEKFESRELNIGRMLPWTLLFRGFQVALDPKKLLLGAGGVLALSLGWWLLGSFFYWVQGKRPDPGDFPSAAYADKAGDPKELAWRDFQAENRKWKILHRAAGPDGRPTPDARDLASNNAEYEAISTLLQRVRDKPDSAATIHEEIRAGKHPLVAPLWEEIVAGKHGRLAPLWPDPTPLPHGEMRIWPWFEDRGPNPYLWVVGKAPRPAVKSELEVLIEPLVKFLRPVIFLLTPGAGFINRVYFLLALTWTVAVWAIFGGAITRMAVVQVARNERVGLRESLRFVWERKWSYVVASMLPLGFLAAMVVLIAALGLGNMIPFFAEIWDSLLWPFIFFGGFVMAMTVAGLAGWPMIHVTLSAEGSDSFDALSRSYSYVYQNPWQYIWYCLVGLSYGAVVTFFVGFMGSLTVYLGKWAFSLTPFVDSINRDPSYMFLFAPTSFGWRDLLLEGVHPVPSVSSFYWWNWIGTCFTTFWLYAFFLLMIGFGYSFFWSEFSIIYLLMRHKVDDTELDEVYLEEDDSEEVYNVPAAPTAAPTTQNVASASLPMVEAPTFRSSAAPAQKAVTVGDTATAAAPVVVPAPATPAKEGDNPASSGGNAKPAE